VSAASVAAPLSGHMLLPVPRKMTARLCAVVLAGQAPILLFAAFGARALLGVQDPERAGLFFGVGLTLALACVVVAGLVRMRLGILLGWVIQIATLLSALALPAMLAVTFIFGGLWVVALVQGRKLDDLTYAYVTDGPQE